VSVVAFYIMKCVSGLIAGVITLDVISEVGIITGITIKPRR
jgi:hypothetical protein